MVPILPGTYIVPMVSVVHTMHVVSMVSMVSMVYVLPVVSMVSVAFMVVLECHDKNPLAESLGRRPTFSVDLFIVVFVVSVVPVSPVVLYLWCLRMPFEVPRAADAVKRRRQV